MRKLRNTLYITNPDMALGRDGECIIVRKENMELGRFPIHILENIVAFNRTGMSPAAMDLCLAHQVSVNFMTPYGRLCARLEGPTRGNVLLRRTQYRWADSSPRSLHLARIFITAKLANQRRVIERALSDHKQLDDERLQTVREQLGERIDSAWNADGTDELLGIEGEGARSYFSVFNDLIVQQQDFFILRGRTRRPPLDPVNALLSFAYGLIRMRLQNALETVGLDPFVGFYHTDRPGRASLALDMMEELRPYMGDRFVLSLINRQQIHPEHFLQKENHAVQLTDDGRRLFIDAWNKREQDTITHPYLEETIEVGLLPYVQATLMASHIRGDLDGYPPFFMR